MTPASPSRPLRTAAGRVRIAAGRVVAPDGDLTPGWVEVADGRIAAVQAGWPDAADVAQPRGVVLPGLVDLQVNGAAGVDFLTVEDPAALDPALLHLAATGVTGFLPTLISAPLPLVRRALEVLSAARAADRPGPRILGVHLEGPFLDPAHAGAHDGAWLQAPSAELAEALLDGPGAAVRLVTLAPELPGAGAVIAALRARGVVVAAGHSGADLTVACAAFDAGVAMVTHLFNAMRPFHHREPGLAGAALLDGRVRASLILDDVHLHPATAALALRLLGPERAVLVTDAVAAAGAPPGTYRLGTREVVAQDGAVRLPDGTLAGSLLTMDAAVRRALALGATYRDVARMAALTPAALLGVPAGLRPGNPADLVVLDESGQVELTLVGGAVVFQAGRS